MSPSERTADAAVAKWQKARQKRIASRPRFDYPYTTWSTRIHQRARFTFSIAGGLSVAAALLGKFTPWQGIAAAIALTSTYFLIASRRPNGLPLVRPPTKVSA